MLKFIKEFFGVGPSTKNTVTTPTPVVETQSEPVVEQPKPKKQAVKKATKSRATKAKSSTKKV